MQAVRCKHWKRVLDRAAMLTPLIGTRVPFGDESPQWLGISVRQPDPNRNRCSCWRCRICVKEGGREFELSGSNVAQDDSGYEIVDEKINRHLGRAKDGGRMLARRPLLGE